MTDDSKWIRLADIAGAIGQAIPAASTDETIKAATAVANVIATARLRMLLDESQGRLTSLARTLERCGVEKTSIITEGQWLTLRATAGATIRIRMRADGMWRASCDTGLITLDTRLDYQPEDLDRRVLAEASAQCSQALEQFQTGLAGYVLRPNESAAARQRLNTTIGNLDASLAALVGHKEDRP